MHAALDPRRNVSVAASAGSGKTWLLTARMVRLLLAGVPAERILALTFTRKAAAEMSTRVRSRLRAFASADDDTLDAELRMIDLVPDAALRERARGLYEALLFDPMPLRATTIHAFCQDIVSRFALEAGVAPGFDVVENEAGLLDEAWQALQHELLAEPEGAAALAAQSLIDFGESEAALRQIVLGFLQRRGDWYAYAGEDADPLDATERLRRQLDVSEDDDPERPEAHLALNAKLRMLQHWLERIGGSRWIKAEPIAAAMDLSGAALLDGLFDALFTAEGEPYRLSLRKDQARRLSDDELEHIHGTHGEVVQELQRLRELCLRLTTLRRSRAAFTLGCAALRHLRALCDAQHALGFIELEWHACKLLSGDGAASWVQYKLDARIDHLLVDEFQDTSPTQWRALLPLLSEMAAGDVERARSAFIVGDVKQSIYGFRRANPELMQEACSFLGRHMNGAAEQLAHSWRSAPGIIDFVNALFAQPGLREWLADFPRHQTHRTSDWSRIELAPLIEAQEAAESAPQFRNPLQAPRPDPDTTRALREGQLIAARIQALVGERIEIEVHGERRALGYGDIMILLRARTHASALEQALADAGVPFVGSARGTLLDTAELQDMLALLRHLNSPLRDLDLAQVLRSPLFGAGDEELIALARQSRAADSSWAHALQEAGTSPALDRARRLLPRWAGLARRLPAHDLLDRIFDEGDVVARYESALPAAEAARVRGNLCALLHLALEADSGRFPTLGKFLQFLRQAQTAVDGPDEAPPPAAEGQVRVLTVHAAKGLEAPAVFLAQAGSVPADRGAVWIVEWPHDASAPTHFLLTADKLNRDGLSARLLALQQARARREEANLLYVAVTRARQFLFISGCAPLKRNPYPSAWEFAQAAFDALGVGSGESPRVYVQGEMRTGAPVPAAPPEAPVDPRLTRPLAPHVPEAQQQPSPVEPEQIDRAAVRHGHLVHYLLQQLSARPAADPARLLAGAQARFGPGVNEKGVGRALAEARGVLAAPALARFFEATQVRRAWNEVPVRSAQASGIIDRLVDDGERLWILDYKTSPETEDAVLIERYAGQLQAYATAVRALWPQRSLRAALVLTAQQRWIDIPVSS